MHLSRTRSSAVPECYVGLWRRRLLRDAHGEDTRTQVLWLQSGSLYADLRLPAERDAEDGIARQQGFAGRLEARDNLLTWRRWLDFQPPSGVEDVGLVRFTGLNEMVEQGVHADYEEVWERIAPASPDRAAFSLQVEHTAAGLVRRRAGVLVIVGEHFMFALDRLAALPAAPSLRALSTQSQLDDDVREHLFACEISFGRRRRTDRWEILHSTVRAREGRHLFDAHGALHACDDARYAQQTPDGTRRLWCQIERGASFFGF